MDKTEHNKPYIVWVQDGECWTLFGRYESFLASLLQRERAMGSHGVHPDKVLITKEVDWTVEEIR